MYVKHTLVRASRGTRQPMALLQRLKFFQSLPMETCRPSDGNTISSLSKKRKNVVEIVVKTLQQLPTSMRSNHTAEPVIPDDRQLTQWFQTTDSWHCDSRRQTAEPVIPDDRQLTRWSRRHNLVQWFQMTADSVILDDSWLNDSRWQTADPMIPDDRQLAQWFQTTHSWKDNLWRQHGRQGRSEGWEKESALGGWVRKFKVVFPCDHN